MPRRDGSGPMGQGPLTGRGFGPCGVGYAGNFTPGRGFGRGMGRGFGRGMGYGMGYGFAPAYGFREFAKVDKETLEDEKEFLKNRLNEIDEELKDL